VVAARIRWSSDDLTTPRITALRVRIVVELSSAVTPEAVPRAEPGDKFPQVNAEASCPRRS
jgi:hypothetical protein